MSIEDPIKVYDARWEMDDFSDDEVRRLLRASLAYGRSIEVDTVVITRDARLHAAHLMQMAAEEAVRMGLRVYLRPEPISTPQAYFTALCVSEEHPRTMGLAITASHNPRQYIGIKFTVPTVQAIGLDCGPSGGLRQVRHLYHSSDTFEPVSGGSLHMLELGREYVDFSMAQSGVGHGDLDGLSVVIDSLHGSAGPEIYTALTRAGVRVEAVHLVPDARFPAGSPNPTSAGKMEKAIALAREHDLQLTIGIDGDGDRVVFGDQRGILTAGFIAVPILRQLGLTEGPDQPTRVMYDPKVNPLALAEWGRLNIQPVLFRNGHSQIKHYMTAHRIPAAVEESGHHYYRITKGDLTISTENSIMTVLLLLKAVKEQPGLLDELWSEQQLVCTTGEFNYQFHDDDVRDAAESAVVSHFAAHSAEVTTTTPDGVDLDGTLLNHGVQLNPGAVVMADDWYRGFVRISTNEKHVLRCYFSTGSADRGEQLRAEAAHIMEEQFNGKLID